MLLFGGEQSDLRKQQTAQHSSHRQHPVQQREGCLFTEGDVVVEEEGGEVGGPDDGQGVAVVNGGETDDETEEGRAGDVDDLDGFGVVDYVGSEESGSDSRPVLL